MKIQIRPTLFFIKNHVHLILIFLIFFKLDQRLINTQKQINTLNSI